MTLMTDLSAAFALGLVGAGHCLAMCGGILSALAVGAGKKVPLSRVFAYNFGRIGGYAALGALSAGVLALLPASPWPIARTLAGIILIVMGLHIAQFWSGILWLERLGASLWRFIKPLASHFLPVKNNIGALVVGFVWGWLPCGLVYSALAYATTQANAAAGALTMLAFGAGTLPAMVTGGTVLSVMRRALNQHWLRLGLGVAYIGFGVWTLWLPWQHLGHHQAKPAAEAEVDMPDHHHHH